MDTGFLWPMLGLIGGWAGSYLGSYLKKKAENLATHEDVDKLLKQVTAVTEATKAIEAKISGEVWDRQKRWELKREVLFEAVRRLADVEGRLLSLDSAFRNEPGAGASWSELSLKAAQKWNAASAAFDEAELLVEMACDEGTAVAFRDFRTLVNGVAFKITSNRDLEVYGEMRRESERRRVAVQAAVRRELGVGVGQ